MNDRIIINRCIEDLKYICDMIDEETEKIMWVRDGRDLNAALNYIEKALVKLENLKIEYKSNKSTYKIPKSK